MQRFTAKWNGQEESFELDCDCTFKDLQEALQSIFALSSCKITGLKQKLKQGKKHVFQQTNECEQHHEKLTEWFVLPPVQKLLVVGCKSDSIVIHNAKEEHKMQEQEEIFEEEPDYENILAMQQFEIQRKFDREMANENRRMRQQNRHACRNQVAKALTLCHNGDEEMLRRIWEPDFNDVILQLAKCAIRNDKLSVLMYLKNKRRLELVDYFKLLQIAAKYGHFQSVAVLFKEVEKDINQTTNINGVKVLENAISRGHIRVARWILRYCQSIMQSTTQPSRTCLSRACRGLYSRTLEWVCATFPDIVLKEHVTLTMSRPSDKEKAAQCTNIFFNQPSLQWLPEDYNLFLQTAVAERNAFCIKLLLNKQGQQPNIDMNKGAILKDAIESGSLEIVQEIVQAMQQLRFPDNIWYRNVVSDEDFCQNFILTAIRQHHAEIMLYLFNTIALNETHMESMATMLCVRNNRRNEKDIQFLTETLDEREKQERVAEFAATHIAQLFVGRFPVDVNRIIIEYHLGVDGRHANQFQKEAAHIKALIESQR